MYQVTMYDGLEDKVGQVIHSHTTGELKLKSGTIKQGINSFDTFSFDYLPNSPLFNNIRTGVTLIKVLNTVTGRYEFEGRIVTPEEEMNSGVSLHAICESELGFLNDSDQDFYEFRGTPEELLHRILNYHNSAVESSKNFTLGRVEITDPNDYYYVFLDPEETSWEAIKRTLLDKYGGEIVMRKENGVRYLDYLKQHGHDTDVTIALDKNLKSYRRVTDITKIYSRIKPLGNTLEPDEISEEDRESQVKYPRLTIESVNKGSKYLDSPELIKNIGVKIGTIKFDDITTAERLKSSGQSYLDSQKLVLVQYTIDALDLALIGKDFESFEVGNTYVLINQVMNINERLRVVGKTINILAPWNNALEIGDKMKTANEIQLDLNRQVKYAVTLQQQLQTAKQLLSGRIKIVSTLANDASSNYDKLTNETLPDLTSRLEKLEKPTDPTEPPTSYIPSFDLGYTVDLADYGAKLNDSTFDNTQAFIDASNAIKASGQRGTVILPKGDIYIDPNLPLASNVNIVGQGSRESVIKLKPSAENFWCILHADNKQNINLGNLGIDSNYNARKSAGKLGDLANNPQIGLSMGALSQNIFAENIKMKTNGVWMVASHLGSQHPRNIKIRDSYFEWTMGYATPDKPFVNGVTVDNTLIYFDTIGYEFINNVVKANTPIATMTGLEAHGADGLVEHNTFIDIRTGVIPWNRVNNEDKDKPNNIIIRDNEFINVLNGADFGLSPTRDMKNVQFTDNEITLDPAKYPGAVFSRGVILGVWNGFGNGEVSEDILVARNKVKSKDYQMENPDPDVYYNYYGIGIGSGIYKNLQIYDNTIENMPSFGILVQNEVGKTIKINSGVIKNNTIKNVAKSTVNRARVISAIRIAQKAEVDVSGLTVEPNTIIDTRSTTETWYYQPTDMPTGPNFKPQNITETKQ